MPKIVTSEKPLLATQADMLADLVSALKKKGVIADENLDAATIETLKGKNRKGMSK